MKIMVMDVDGDFFVFDDTAFSVQADRGPKGWDVDIYNDIAPEGAGITFASGLTEEAGARDIVAQLRDAYFEAVSDSSTLCLKIGPVIDEQEMSDETN